MSSISGLPGYQLVPLREGADFILYRGRQNGNPSPILVVTPTAEYPRPRDLRRLEHEYSLASKLDSAWAAKPLTLSQHQGKTILILEDSGGEPLDRILQLHQGKPLDLTRFLSIAIGLATALGHAHRQDLIHKDIKPANVLVDDAGRVWLTGFGIASQLPQEHQTPAPPEIIAGTLPYMAQALSSEIVLPTLIERLMRIAVEHAGAERGLLILLRGDEPQTEAEATTSHDKVEVAVRGAAVSPSDLPLSALHYVIRIRNVSQCYRNSCVNCLSRISNCGWN
jgi:serine/threonine protein kinase